MAGPSITIDDVREALEALKRQGVPDPGVHRIRAHLGRGSVTTINKYKHQIRLAEAERLLPAIQKPIPDPITELAARTWEELLGALDQIDAEREQETAAALAAMQQELDAANSAEREARDQARALQQALEATEASRDEIAAQRDATLADLKEARHTLALREQSIAHLNTQIDTLREDLVAQGRQAAERETELRRALDTAREERLAERREAETERAALRDQVKSWRDQFEQQHQYFESQLKARDEQLAALRAELKALEQAHRQLDASLDDAESRNRELAAAVAQVTAERDTARQAQTHAERERAQAIEETERQRIQFEGMLADLRATIAALQAAADKDR